MGFFIRFLFVTVYSVFSLFLFLFFFLIYNKFEERNMSRKGSRLSGLDTIEDQHHGGEVFGNYNRIDFAWPDLAGCRENKVSDNLVVINSCHVVDLGPQRREVGEFGEVGKTCGYNRLDHCLHYQASYEERLETSKKHLLKSKSSTKKKKKKNNKTVKKSLDKKRGLPISFVLFVVLLLTVVFYFLSFLVKQLNTTNVFGNTLNNTHGLTGMEIGVGVIKKLTTKATRSEWLASNDKTIANRLKGFDYNSLSENYTTGSPSNWVSNDWIHG